MERNEHNAVKHPHRRKAPDAAASARMRAHGGAAQAPHLREDMQHGDGAERIRSHAAPEQEGRARDAASREARTPDARLEGARMEGSQPHAPRRRRPSRRSRTLARWRHHAVTGFGLVVAAGFVVGLLFFARPTASAVENRELTQFPTFTWEGFLDGSFTNQLSLWFADTYPLREPLVSLDQWLESLYGVNTGEQMIGGNVQADELPVPAEEGDDSQSQQAEVRESVEVPTEEAMAADIQAQIMNGLYVNNGAAYSIYYFSQEAVQGYTGAVNACAQALEGQAKVYSVLAPNSSAVLDDVTRERLGGTDMKQAIDYFNSLYDPSVGTVDSWQAIRDHADEYLYFRTDHHWTQLGAYYVYQKLCETMGIEPVSWDGQETMTFDGFLGTYYGQLRDPTMAANPDYVEAHIPNGTNDMTYWDESGAEVQGHVINDVTGWNQNSLYGTFIAGDQPLEHIHNPAKDDGSSCLVIKDSFGCAFSPLLVDNFEDLYIIDFRHSDQNIPQFVRDNGIQNVVFVNNISLAGTLTVGDKLASMM